MQRHRLISHLARRYLLVSLLAVMALAWYAAFAFDRALTRSVWTELEAAANLTASETASLVTAGDESAVREAARRVAQTPRMRITIVLPDGRPVFDSRDDVSQLRSQADRPEIATALAGSPGHDVRETSTGNERVMYLAVPVRYEGQIVAAARAATSAAEIDRVYRASLHALFWGILLVAAAAAAVGWWMAARTARPVAQLAQAAQRLAAGEPVARVAPPEIAELGSLAAALNTITQQLSDRTLHIDRQGDQQQAILASMVEGVLAVDSYQRLIALNSAAAELIGQKPADLQGQNLQEVLRNADLRRFVSLALRSPELVEDDLILHGKEDRILRVRGTALRDDDGREVGAVIVLNDVTQYRRLENLRRDFVANVSHELKTPIASIKGFVETLLDGALQNPDDARRFLEIIAKQTDRLHNIIEDLLSLSKIEQSEEAASLQLEEVPLRPVLEAAITACQPNAAAADIEIQLHCDNELMAPINPPLLEQAIVNLIDNAIKYSERASHVVIEARFAADELMIDVRDHGCGIGAEHLPRLFERFYRVDRARSRKLGGTGLGLAIVKHIVQAHRGKVAVQSTPGEGSVFSIHLPLVVPAPVA
jgi:two-component system, OmpR family, phosphate regulon sensor histidine kinase PhoR